MGFIRPWIPYTLVEIVTSLWNLIIWLMGGLVKETKNGKPLIPKKVPNVNIRNWIGARLIPTQLISELVPL